MNRIGMIIDVSHVSDETFFQIIELSKAPVVATHSCCRAFTPGFERNMSDEMIKLLAEKGGVIQINFGSMFVSKPVNEGFSKRSRQHVGRTKRSRRDIPGIGRGGLSEDHLHAGFGLQ